MVAMIITITVAGTIALQYLPHLMICPDFAAVATPTTFAEAPIRCCAASDIRTHRKRPCKDGKVYALRCCKTVDNRDHCCCKRDIINKCTCYCRNPDDDRDHQIQVATADLTDQVQLKATRTPVCSRPPTTTNKSNKE